MKPVEIKVMQRANKTLYFEVSVTSEAFPRSSFVGIMEQGKEDNEAQAIGILAGAMTEELCERLSDSVTDPGRMALAAVECYRELVAENPHIFLGNELPRDADGRLTAGVVPFH